MMELESHVVMPLSSLASLLEQCHNCPKGNVSEVNIRSNIESNYNYNLTNAAFDCCQKILNPENIMVINSKNESAYNLIEYIKRLFVWPNFIEISDGSLGVHIEVGNLPIENEESLSLNSDIKSEDPLAIENNPSNNFISIDDKEIISKPTNRDLIPKLVSWSHKIDSAPETEVTDPIDHRKKYPESFICEYCGKCFTGKDRAYYFYLHRNREHTQEMNYKCSKCEKCFWGDRELVAHMATHANTGHICHVCGIMVATKKNLNAHILIHFDRKFKCSYCDKQFTRADHLKVHERIHSGVRPYRCKNCDSGFCQNRQLKLHMKTCPLTKDN